MHTALAFEYICIHKGCFRLINDIAVTFYQYIAGHPAIMALMVIMIIVMMLFALKCGKIIVLMLLIPLLSTMIVSTAMIELPKYAVVLMWIIVGFIFGGAIIAYAFRT